MCISPGVACGARQCSSGAPPSNMQCFAAVLFLLGAVSCAEFENVFEWKEMDFRWPDEAAKKAAIADGEYVQSNNLPLGIDRWNDKLFVTIPRWKSGVAATLAYIPLNATSKSPQLIPYPSWEANTLPKNRSKHGGAKPIISVFRIRVDQCDRLWVMDTGLADILGAPKQYYKPALLVYDLKTDALLRRYPFKDDLVKEDSFFANVVVDVTKDSCEDAFAYIPDLGAYGVVVYSLKSNDSWRVKHNYFHFDPLNGEYNVAGVEFQWTDGVFGLALSKVQPNGFRDLYFHALSSTKEFVVSTEILRNETRAVDPHTYHEYKLLGDRGSKTHATASYMDEPSDVLFFTQVNRNGVACWNTNKPLNYENFALVASSNETLVFPNDLTVDKENQLWVLSDKMPVFIYRELDPNEINYRIMKMKIPDAIKGTPCA